MSDKTERILELRDENYSMGFIAREVGLSRERVRQICQKYGKDGRSKGAKYYSNAAIYKESKYENLSKIVLEEGNIQNFAEKAGIGYHTVRYALMGKNISKKIIDKLIKATGKTYEYLFEEAD